MYSVEQQMQNNAGYEGLNLVTSVIDEPIILNAQTFLEKRRQLGLSINRVRSELKMSH